MGFVLQLAALAVSLAVFVAVSHFRAPKDLRDVFSETLPRVDLQRGYFAWMKTWLKSVSAMRDIVAEGYDRFSKHGRLFVLSSPGSGPLVVLPLSLLHILSRPDNQVAAFEIQLETFQPRYTIGNKEPYESTIKLAFKIVQKYFTKDLGRFADIMALELAATIDEGWGSSTTWSTVNIYDSCSQIISRTMSRVFVGIPLCHDEVFLQQSRQYSTAAFGSAAIISMLPSRLRRILGPLIAIPAQKHLTACKRILLPHVESRMRQSQRRNVIAHDALQWMIDEANKSQYDKIGAAHLTQSLLILMMFSIHGTAYALTNSILDLYSSKSSDTFVPEIRKECERVSADNGGLGNREAVAGLHLVDSCIKESLRISGFTIVSSTRAISATNGLHLDDGTVLPQGLRVSVPLQAIHHDPFLYEDPSRFNAFRFAGINKPHHENDQRSSICTAQEPKREPCVNINEKFLTFGIGKHACPGRFFASQMMNLAMAYIIQNYDIERIPKRPHSQPILNILMPPTSTVIKIRRKV